MRKIIFYSLVLSLFSCKNDDKNKSKNNNSIMTQNTDWMYTTNIYEVNLRQYTQEGNFKSFMKELTRLQDMGVKTLWFMPITPISKENRKGSLGSYYACSDYTSVNSEFGSLQDFKSLVDTAQKMGFKVIMDWVANHTGWDHVWTRTHPEYYKKGNDGKFYDKNGWDDVIDLDYLNKDLRAAMINAMKFWIKECNLDGFRCDMAMLVPVDFWKEAKAELDKVKPLFWFAEADMLSNPEYFEVFHAGYTWTWMHKTEEFCKHKIDITGLDSVLFKYDTINPKSSLKVYFTSNHDENTWNGTEYEKFGDAAKLFAVFSCTWNGIPMLYSGQELPNKKRLNFFERDPIVWTDRPELHLFYKTLLNLHSLHPALKANDSAIKTIRIKTDADNNVFAFVRKKENREVFVLLNLSGLSPLRFEVQDKNITGIYKNVFGGRETDFTNEKFIELSAWDFLVFEK